MAIFGSIATVRNQAPATRGFATALAYVDDLLRPGSAANARLHGMAAGAVERHELGGGVFVMEQVYQTKPRSAVFFESHRKYIDLQLVVAGEEVMEVIDRSRSAEKQPYAAERDLIMYHDVAGASIVRLSAGHATVFFPVDVHMPSLELPTGPGLVRKAVIKIPVE